MAALGQDAVEDYVRASIEREVRNGNFEEDYITSESPNEESTNKVKDTLQKNETAKMLVHAATLMEIVDDYSSLQKLTGNDDVFLSRSKAKLAEIKSQLKKLGYNIETQDDVFNVLSMSEEGSIIQQLIDRTLPEEQKVSSL